MVYNEIARNGLHYLTVIKYKNFGGKSMKKTKLISLMISCFMTASLVAGCGSSASTSTSTKPATDNKPVKITMLNSKGEIQSQLEDAAKAFTKTNPKITLEVVPCPAGGSPFEKISAMYAAGNAPSLSILDPGDIPKFKEKFLDLSSKKWVADASTGALDAAKVDGKSYGFPLAIEGYGIIYNKTVLTKAGVDPKTITTQDSLEAAFKKVKAAGVAPIVISPMDWSLAAHLLPIAYTNQGKSSVGTQKYLTDLKAGNAVLSANKSFNGLIKTFDLMKQYNLDKKAPLDKKYENNQQDIATGKVGFWFMGNWTWPQIKAIDKTGDYGFIPVPTSNNAADYGNTQVTAGPSKFIAIDKTNNDENQQAASEKFLEWLIYSPEGQNILVNKCNAIPAFKNITLPLADPLGKSIKSYIDAGKIIPTIPNLPTDHWSALGAEMQKYLAGKTDKEGLAKSIEAYWKSAQ